MSASTESYGARLNMKMALSAVRLGWLSITSEAFLFAANAALLGVPRSGVFVRQAHVFEKVIPILGFFLALIVYLGILAALHSVRRLTRHWECREQPPEIPPVAGAKFTHLLGLLAPTLVPPLFMGAWAYLQLGPTRLIPPVTGCHYSLDVSTSFTQPRFQWPNVALQEGHQWSDSIPASRVVAHGFG